VATTAPQTSMGLLAVGPDMAKVLAVDDNMVKAIQFEYCLRFYASC
jgi:hypothetical protein